MGTKNVRYRYLYLLVYFACSLPILSCKTSSHNSQRFYPSPVATTTTVKASSHYGKDSLLLIFTNTLEKAHFVVETVNQGIITTTKKRDNVYYKYRIELSDGQVVISGQYEIVIPKDILNPNPPAPLWNPIHYGEDGRFGARGFEDIKIFLESVHDAVLSYNK